MPLFRKKPIAVEAILWTGDNYDQVAVFCGGSAGNIVDLRGETIIILMRDVPSVEVAKGQWILKEPFPTDARKFYTCEASTFDKTFEPVPTWCTACGRNQPVPEHFAFLCETCIREP